MNPDRNRYFCMIIANYLIIITKTLYRSVALLLLTMMVLQAHAQKKIKLEPGAVQLVGFKKDGVSYTSVTGDVKFTHKGTVFYCDSAVLAKKTNYLEAYGAVRIIDDSVTITARRLKYDGNNRIAQLRSNVVLTKLEQLQIFTDYLDYDRNTGISSYFNDGKIVDSTNVLTSEKGYYNSVNNMASFKTNVVGKNDDYRLNSDTLVYNTTSGEIYFVAQTTLTDNDDNVFVYEGGKYNSKQKRSDFDLGRVETEDFFIAGDNMRLDDVSGIYSLKTNVTMYGKENSIIITGNGAIHDRKKDITKVFDSPLMRMVAENDTLFVSADTLVSMDSPLASEKRLLAYSNVKIFKNDIQGVTDSLVYVVADSVLQMFGAPVLWSDGNQMSADSVSILVRNSTLEKMDMQNNAFVITKDSVDNFNQIKGRNLTASFKDDELSQVYVSGNGESVFFQYSEESGELMGMNTILCSDIGLYFKDQKLTNASFLGNPEGRFIPPHVLKDEDKQLSGFSWREQERPDKASVVAGSPKAVLPKSTIGEISIPDNSLIRQQK